MCISFAVMKMRCPASMSINGMGWYEVRSSSLSTCLSTLASFTFQNLLDWWYVPFHKIISYVHPLIELAYTNATLPNVMKSKLISFFPFSLQACIASKIPKIWNRRIYCPLYQVYSNVAKSLLLTTGLLLTLFLSSLGFLKCISLSLRSRCGKSKRLNKPHLALM